MNEEYNDIDKIFQETFSKGPSEEDFSLPSDHMFENAMEVINNKEDNRNRRLILFLLLGVTLLVSILGIYTITEIDEIKSKHSNIAVKTENKIQEVNSDGSKNERITSENTDLQSINTNQATSKSNIAINNKSKSSSYLEKTASNKNTNLLALSEKYEPTIDINRTASNVADSTDEDEIAGKGEHITQPLQVIQLSGLLNYQRQSNIVQGWTQSEHQTRKTREVYLSTRSQWTKFNMGDIKIQDAELTQYDQNYQGYSFGIGINQELSKRWSLQLEIGYNSISNESKYTKDILYDKSKETTDPLNGRSYSTDITTFSPLIKDQFNLSGSVDHLQMNDQEMVTQKSLIKNDLQYTYTRAIPMYSLINTNKWNWRIGIGAQFNILINSCELNTTSLYKGSSMIIEGSHENTDKKMLSTLQVNLLATQEISYQLDQNFRIGLHSEFNKGLNALNKEDLNSPGRTFAQGWSLGINFYYNL